MKKTYSQRILDYLVQNEHFDRKAASRKFREVKSKDIHSNVMRVARYLEENGLLKRVSPGTFTITRKGMNRAYSN